MQRQIHPVETSGRDRCHWPWTGAYISYEGLPMPGCMVATPNRINFGNMAEHGVEAIWSGSPYEDFRARLVSDNPLEICRCCSILFRHLLTGSLFRLLFE
ncbi:MAG TPA: SPASM domain-containing protein [Anaerolineae bacterium]|nr:SPASM domain-containing protein [Anaerolineae bacterium]